MLHIIRQQHLHVELNGTESDGMALQRRLPALCRDWLLPALERILDRHAPAEGTLCIERLEIDAGIMSLDRLEHDLAEAAAQALDKALREQFPVDETTAAERSYDKAQRKTVQQSVNEAFLFFLETGQLPWSFRLPEGRRLEHAVLDAWETAAQANGSVSAVKAALRQVLASPFARKRLTRQFTPMLLNALLVQLAPQAAMEPVFAVLRRSSLAAAKRQVERLVWESAFAKAAAGGAVSTEELISDVLLLLADEHAEAAELLLRYFPLADADSSISLGQMETEIYPRHAKTPAHSDKKNLTGKIVDVGVDSLSETFSAQKQSNFPTTDTTTGSSIAETEEEIEPPYHKATPAPRDKETLVEKYSRAGVNSSTKPSNPLVVQKQSASPLADSTTNTSFAETEAVRHAATYAQETQAGKSSQIAASDAERGLLSAQKPLVKPALAAVPPAHFIAQHKSPNVAAEGIYISNAGLVLLHPFLPQFFGALGIAADKQLLQPERALCLLHFLATGQPVAPEFELMLPKVLCNIPLEEPVEADADLTAAEQDEAVALLSAVIRHWDALRNTSPDALRGTFFVRPGKISLRDDDWLLQVEPQTWDILLDQLPWGIGMIKLPWMDRLLHVEWR